MKISKSLRELRALAEKHGLEVDNPVINGTRRTYTIGVAGQPHYLQGMMLSEAKWFLQGVRLGRVIEAKHLEPYKEAQA